MASLRRADLDPDARDDFLGVGGTGVISLPTGADSPPHSVPVSYGYDRTTGSLYFRLASDQESGKGDVSDRPASFVTYGQPADEDRWVSVVASGTLERVDSEGISTETLAGLERVDIPIVDTFDRPVTDVSFEFLRLVPDEFTARREQRADS